MIVYYCDRCKQEIKSVEEGRFTLDCPVNKTGKHWRFEYERYQTKQYCPSCMSSLLEAITEWEQMKGEEK